MNQAIEGGLARFWHPIEAATETLASASPPELQAVLTSLVDLVAADLVPRLRAEERVLLPLVSTDPESGRSIGLNPADVSRLAETLSSLAHGPSGSNTGPIRRTATRLLALLEDQRRAENALVARVRDLLSVDRGAGVLGERLEEQAQASRASQIFISEPDRMPTEAWVLRHNPKPPQVERVEQWRPSPIADLVAALEMQE